MARKYAAVMALLGLSVVLLRALKDGASFEGTITTGLMWMVCFGAVGYLVGAIARSTVDESVQRQVEAELQKLSVETQEQTSATA